jgi:hypothetical protein
MEQDLCYSDTDVANIIRSRAQYQRGLCRYLQHRIEPMPALDHSLFRGRCLPVSDQKHNFLTSRPAQVLVTKVWLCQTPKRAEYAEKLQTRPHPELCTLPNLPIPYCKYWLRQTSKRAGHAKRPHLVGCPHCGRRQTLEGAHGQGRLLHDGLEERKVVEAGLRLAADPGHDLHRLLWIRPRGRLPAQHDAICPVEDGVGHVGRLCAGRPGGLDHGLEHLQTKKDICQVDCRGQSFKHISCKKRSSMSEEGGGITLCDLSKIQATSKRL